MTAISVRGPHGQSPQSIKRGTTRCGTQRSLGQHTACIPQRCRLDDRSRGDGPEVQHTVIDLRRNARGVRDPARVLRLRTAPGRSALRQQAAALESVNPARRRPLKPAEMAVDSQRAGEAARDERWCCGGKTGPPRGLGQALAPHPGAVLASGVGRRNDAGLLPRQARREPVGLTRGETDHWGASTRQLDPAGPSRSKSRARLCRCGRAATAGSVRPSAALNRSRCPTASWAGWSTDMPVDGRYKSAISTFRTLPSVSPICVGLLCPEKTSLCAGDLSPDSHV